jgi:hypothetical protein
MEDRSGGGQQGEAAGMFPWQTLWTPRSALGYPPPAPVALLPHPAESGVAASSLTQPGLGHASALPEAPVPRPGTSQGFH